MIASQSVQNGQHDERMSVIVSPQKIALRRLYGEPGAFQFDTLACNDDLAYTICQRARWRCEICQMAAGSKIFNDGGFSRVVLTVDTQARRPRVLCQRCRVNATEELPILPMRKKVIGRVKLVKVGSEKA